MNHRPQYIAYQAVPTADLPISSHFADAVCLYNMGLASENDLRHAAGLSQLPAETLRLMKEQARPRLCERNQYGEWVEA